MYDDRAVGLELGGRPLCRVQRLIGFGTMAATAYRSTVYLAAAV
jgi:hypothetical protein